jgi:MoxR-like ATPase
MRIHLGYPSHEDETRILDLNPGETPLNDLKPVMTAQELIDEQNKVYKVQVDPSLADYIVNIANATRQNEQLQIGVSPRGSLALHQAARATAHLLGRDYVVPDDIISNVVPVCAHRVISRNYMHDADGVANGRIMQQVLETVPSPV